MRFNAFAWELYAKSSRGKSAIRRFSRLTSKSADESLRFYELDVPEQLAERYPAGPLSIDIAKLVREAISSVGFATLEDAHRYYSANFISKGIPIECADLQGKSCIVGVFGEDAESWYDYISPITIGLYGAYPAFFLPYNFRTKFNQLEEIHSAFGIPLPVIPGRSDKAGRGEYYFAINESWREFRITHELSPPEMCAFLYDYAPEFVTALSADDLPAPSKAWMVSGGSWDIEFVENAADDTVARWGGNAAVRRGDILMMYLVKPRRAISSIWLACCDGFIDPFFHYHSTVWICSPVPTQSVSYTDMIKHPLLGLKPAVRGHFQGPCSRSSFTVDEYEAVLGIMKSKGQDIAALPQLPSWGRSLPPEVHTERDVERVLIEPFIQRLGYSTADWMRQMPVKMGRGERNYPDYAFGAKPKRGEESARMVLESKYELSSHRSFTESFYQAKSYALRLQCRAMVLASREGVWTFPPQAGNFDLKTYVYKSWGELDHPDGFHEMLCLIGRGSIFGEFRKHSLSKITASEGGIQNS